MNDSLGKAPAGEQDGGPVRMSRQELRSSLWLASLYAIRMLGLFLVLPVFALYARQLPGGDDPAWVGFAFGAYGLTQALLQIPYGAASDRFGRKQVITVGLLVMAAGSVLAAMAGGLTVERLAAADPRASVSLMAKKPATYYALGADFGTEADFATRLELADAGPVPSGKTGLVFPGRRIIALYGHPSGPALGVMGEQPPQEAVKRVNDLVRQYQELTPDTPTVPAFEVIATVASSSPGDDGDYSNEGTVEELRPYVEAIGKAGGFAVLDLQPGRASFLSQAQRYQELLALPYVGLALDPEWKIGPDEKPLGRVGNTTAAEVNEVSAWLADFTKSKKLPQKIFIMHQFQLQMIRDREQLNLNHPELSFVLHADGHGDAHDKMATWDKMREGLQPQIFMAWKNFIDEDTPMFDPRQTLGVQPTPWFISYQ